jgi:tetratricopeptide (TPR) repeat protein
MRENFEILVQSLLKDDKQASKEFFRLFNNRLKNVFQKLEDDEIDFLEEQIKNIAPNAITSYIQACCSYIKKDYVRAIELYEQAIDLGNADAMNHRAYMHKNGQGSPVDYAKAIELYDQAIDLGNVSAMNNRAFMHEEGQGGDVDYAKAIALYEQAIALGNASAMNNRACMHQRGQGGPRNYAKATALYRRAHQIQPSKNAFLNNLTNLKNTVTPDDSDSGTVCYHYAAVKKELPDFLKNNPESLCDFSRDELLTSSEKKAIIATFKPSYILKNIEIFSKSDLINIQKKAIILALSGNEKLSVSDFIRDLKVISSINEPSETTYSQLIFN